jgi:membrane protease YdiL (CAAX protease family)
MGIVYSVMTAAAMWQYFRARLPYLYDPWSERLPRPPTLMHAMIAISCLAEGVAALTGAAQGVLGPSAAGPARAVAYGLCAVIVSLVVARFLGKRGVAQSEIWQWREAQGREAPGSPQPTGKSGMGSAVLPVLAGAAIGLVLGAIGVGYLALLHRIPQTADILREAEAQAAAIPHLRASLFVMGVLFAPPAEEYLFRGLLYRALDREWRGWRAVAGSAVFFAIYHPALAWLPVALVGTANALLFKRTGRLAPAVALHMAYNAVVLS